jgi:predicted  nucleic acid-binding Zn-ribbon protein
MSGTIPKCMKCIHYFSTYDQSKPRGCRKFGFQSFKMPSLLVVEETGRHCMAYEERGLKNKKELDLNDPSLW